MENKINDGGTAFPVLERGGGHGMTLRDYFAANAGEPPADFMRLTINDGKFGRLEDALEWRVRWSWAYADAMLKTRTTPTP